MTVSPGGAHLALNDAVTADTRAALEGRSVAVRCTTATGEESVSAEQLWRSGASDLTLMMVTQGEITECSVEARGTSVTVVSMAPVGGL